MTGRALAWARWRSGNWRDTALRRIFANAAILVAGKGANAIFTLAYLALAARALGIEALGALVLIHTYAQAVNELARVRSWEAVLRYGMPALQEGRTKDFHSLLRFTALLDISSGIGSTVLAVLGVGVAAELLGWPADLRSIAGFYCLSILVMAPATPIGLLRLFDRFDLLAIQSTVGSLVRLAGAGALLLAASGLVAFVWLWFAATLCANFALIAFAWRELSRRGLWPGLGRPRRHTTAPPAGLWRFVWATNLNTIVTTLSKHAPTLIAGALLGAGEAALLRIARELADAVSKPTKLLIPAIFPEFARLAALGARGAMRDLVTRSLAIAGVATLTCLIGLWLGGEILLRLILGEDGAPAYHLMLLLGIASLITVWAFPLEPLLLSVGLEGAALRARLAGVFLYVPAMSALIPVAGVIGIGIAAVAGALLTVVAQLTASLRWLGGMSKSGHDSPLVPSGEQACASDQAKVDLIRLPGWSNG